MTPCHIKKPDNRPDPLSYKKKLTVDLTPCHMDGTFQPGTRLPGIRQIAAELRISVIPVKMAWEELDKNGFIKTITGSGTFVNELQSQEIELKQNEKAVEIAERTCNEAKENDISLETIIDLLKKMI